MSDSGQVAVIIPAVWARDATGRSPEAVPGCLGGKSVLVQTLLVFERHAKVDHIIVATPEDGGRSSTR